GKIALIQRGGCEFGWKALQAQNAGAIAVICISIDDDNYTMNPGNYGAGIHIPILMVGLSDGQNISQFAGNGLHVTFVDPGQELPVALDSDLDNSIIIHEYAHGISTRLVGGPSISCMGNVEQMGEGWSDFIALAVTARAGDTGEMRKGFGTYAIRDAPTGRGFRRYPYSTDMNIMPLTYGDIAPSQEIHNLGEVWAAMLWDMYWAFVEKYGWSPDPFETSSGNYKAIRLVFDGLKNTPCNPGFVDGRNAILAAAESLYGGDDICMIWEVFARRGLGYSADQGSPFDAGDQREAFDLPPVCSGNLILEKSVTDFIQPGHEIHVTITAGNYKTDTVTNVLISDEIPEGTNFKVNSSNLPASLQGNRVHFQIGDMVFNNETVITYTLETDPEAWSKRKFLDGIDVENNANWLTYTMGVDASNDWIITENHPAHSGRFTWMSSEVPEQARQALELDPDAYRIHVDGSHPVLRFYHRYKTKAGTNGGIVEVKDVNEENWQQVGDAILRNGYEGKIDYLTFVAPNMEAFSGNSGDDFEATYVDLSNWAGKDIHVRFRFGTGTDTHSGLGWLIDDIEYMDMLSYNSEVCLTTDQGDFECAIAPEGGTIVESREDPTSVAHELNILDAFIYPNPASEYFIVSISGSEQHQGQLSLLSIDGKRIQTQSFSFERQGSIMVSTENVLPGIYLVDVSTSEGVYKAKIFIQ
ncbi:MAG TPA: M36 family metallopeptidase, partial [Saprospiraceae bacterium]